MKSSNKDKIITYIPSSTVIFDLKKQGYFLEAKPIPFRLFKRYIKGEIYTYGTTLSRSKYPTPYLMDLYHERWKIEELYKITKQITEIEEFHSKTERGVKQEIYAHLLLVNLSQFFEFDGKDRLPPMHQEDAEKCVQADFYKFFNPATMFNINFKNCLAIVGHYLENLILGAYEKIKSWVPKVIQMVLRIRKKFDREDLFQDALSNQEADGKVWDEKLGRDTNRMPLLGLQGQVRTKTLNNELRDSFERWYPKMAANKRENLLLAA